MLYFIVSGYIPGTDTQITFDVFMIIAAFTLVSVGLYYLVRNTIRDTIELAESISSLEEVSL